MKAFRVPKGTEGFIIPMRTNEREPFVTRQESVFDDGDERCMDACILHNRDTGEWIDRMLLRGFNDDTVSTVLRFVKMGFDTYLRDDVLLLVQSADVEVM